MEIFTEIKNSAAKTAEEIIEKAGLTKGDILVVGCSTSEVMGSKIGTDSNYETATAIYEGLAQVCDEKGIFIAAQCCEHLNRAIIIEREALSHRDFCNVVPQPKAGGSFATNAYKHFKNPVAVEHIKADAGIDIGFTLIGMHLKEVAVPLRLENNKIGEATVLGARTRAKFIGGERAIYDTSLL